MCRRSRAVMPLLARGPDQAPPKVGLKPAVSAGAVIKDDPCGRTFERPTMVDTRESESSSGAGGSEGDELALRPFVVPASVWGPKGGEEDEVADRAGESSRSDADESKSSVVEASDEKSSAASVPSSSSDDQPYVCSDAVRGGKFGRPCLVALSAEARIRS